MSNYEQEYAEWKRDPMTVLFFSILSELKKEITIEALDARSATLDSTEKFGTNAKCAAHLIEFIDRLSDLDLGDVLGASD